MIHPQKHISQSMCAENPVKITTMNISQSAKCIEKYNASTHINRNTKNNEISMRNTAQILDIARSFSSTIKIPRCILQN